LILDTPLKKDTGLSGYARWVKRSETLKWLLLFIPVIVLFYWKILLTDQFSLLTDNEGVNQAYSWLRFWISSVRHGVLPIWDPYSFAGRSFCGEMQTAAFYPLHLFLALFPLNSDHVLSPFLYHAWFAATHLLAACFLFLLMREFGIRPFAGFVGGICFSLGGAVGGLGWPHLLESSIWLPVIFLFLLRAMRASHTHEWMLNACFSGLALGMSILAGGLHIVIMQALVVVSAGVFHAAHGGRPLRHWLKPVTVVVVIGTICAAAGAVQLLPSMEYSQYSLRWLGRADAALPANQRIPYEYMKDALLPHGILNILIPNAFSGNSGQGEVLNSYIGVFPLIAAIIGIRWSWHNSWVRYLTGLAVAALLYSFGPFSWLNGVLYAIVPKLWLAREAPRMLYVLDFSLSVLAAFGIHELLSRRQEAVWQNLNRGLLALVAMGAFCLLVPGIFGKPDIGPWVSLSIVLIFASYALLLYIARGNSSTSAGLLIVALLLFDLGSFDWTARGRISTAKAGANQLDRNLTLQGAVNFLKSQPGPFRVEVLAEPRPNIGDLFGVQSSHGAGATLPTDFMRVISNRDLMNVRYLVRPASASEPNPVYQDAAWKVYESPTGLPRAWIVHETVIDDTKRNDLPPFDPTRTASVKEPLKVQLDPAAGRDDATVVPSKFVVNQIELRVHAQSRGLMVISETFYPGWRAFVNGAAEEIYQVDGDLRGVVVPAGDSRVILKYRPVSAYAGAGLSMLACMATMLLWIRHRMRNNNNVGPTCAKFSNARAG
jgi:hypothetical protein